MINSEIKTCHECKKDIDTFKYNINDYAYKYDIKHKGIFVKRIYFCCYKCYNKYLTKLENRLKEKEFYQ